MAECIVLKSGGGADLDVVTAGAGDVLAPKVIVGPDGEPLTGTLALSGSALDGHVLAGQTYYSTDPKVKRTGTIPFQGPDAGNNWAHPTATEIWPDGQFFLGVRNGHYLNGVGYIRGYNGNLIPSNVKKGVWIGSLLGTFEGYVPTATDLYLRGNNIAGFESLYTAKLDAGQITIPGATALRDQLRTWVVTTGFNYINIEGVNTYPAGASGNATIRLSYIDGSGNPIVIGNVVSIAMGAFTISFDIRAFQFTAEIRIVISTFTGAIYRIWKS